MSCQSKWCTWISSISQLAVALVIVYAGLIVNKHMESWTTSFEQGSKDLHSIRENMNTIAYSMESINSDMDRMNNTTIGMKNEINMLNKKIDYMNGSVGNMSNKFSPQGMVRSFMPF